MEGKGAVRDPTADVDICVQWTRGVSASGISAHCASLPTMLPILHCLLTLGMIDLPLSVPIDPTAKCNHGNSGNVIFN